MNCTFTHPHDHPCGQPVEMPGTPCHYCQKPVPLDGSPCPSCWRRLDDLPLADVRAIFATDGTFNATPGARDA